MHTVLGVQGVALEVEEHVARVGCRDRVERARVEDLEARLGRVAGSAVRVLFGFALGLEARLTNQSVLRGS